jgi:hypothetical protein
MSPWESAVVRGCGLRGAVGCSGGADCGGVPGVVGDCACGGWVVGWVLLVGFVVPVCVVVHGILCPCMGGAPFPRDFSRYCFVDDCACGGWVVGWVLLVGFVDPVCVVVYGILCPCMGDAPFPRDFKGYCYLGLHGAFVLAVLLGGGIRGE